MHAALNLGDAVAAARAVALVNRLPAIDRDALLSRAVEGVFYTQLVERNQGTQVPDGWIDWLRGEWPDRPDLLNDWSSTWEIDTLAPDEAADVLAGELLDASARRSSRPMCAMVFQLSCGGSWQTTVFGHRPYHWLS